MNSQVSSEVERRWTVAWSWEIVTRDWMLSSSCKRMVTLYLSAKRLNPDIFSSRIINTVVFLNGCKANLLVSCTISVMVNLSQGCEQFTEIS